MAAAVGCEGDFVDVPERLHEVRLVSSGGVRTSLDDENPNVKL